MPDAPELPDGIPHLRTIAMPRDANPAGDIFGGWTLSQMDLARATLLSTVYNVAMATNRTTADFLITSPLFAKAYTAPTGGGDGEPGT